MGQSCLRSTEATRFEDDDDARVGDKDVDLATDEEE